MFLSNGSLVTKTPDFARPLSLTGATWFPYMPGMSSSGWPSAYAGIYRKQLWVYVVVNKLAKATARLPIVVYERDDLNRPRADRHPLAELLRNPNPGMSGYQLLEWTSSTWDLYGDTFWIKQRDGAGNVIGLYPLHPASMKYDDATRTWSWDNGKKRLDNIDDADLIPFRSFDPDSLHRGMSPLEPLRATLENEWSARNATSSFWQRGARPGVVLSHPKKLTQEAMDRLRTQWDALHSGAENHGSTAILEEGMTPQTMTLTAEEAQYIETRKLNREEVCAAYDVPPPVVHILDRATFSNITEQMRSMYRDTMAPRLKGIEAAIEVHLRQPDFGQDNVYAEFLMDEVLRGDFEARAEALSKADYLTFAEKRQIENKPFIDGTDRIFINTATMPLDAIDAQTAAAVAPIAAAIPIERARSVVGRLSWQKAVTEVDADVLTEGLTTDERSIVKAAVAAEVEAGGSVKALRKRILDIATGD